MLSGFVALAAALSAAHGIEPYVHPTIAIPYAATKPVIDGTVDDAEWQGAFSQRALRTTGGQISGRQPRVRERGGPPRRVAGGRNGSSGPDI